MKVQTTMKFSKSLISAVAGLALFPSALLTAEPAAPIAQTSLEARLAKLFRSEGLTASEAAEQAMRSSRDVMAKDAARDGAQASLDSARFAFIPRVVGSASYTRLSDIDPPALGWATVSSSRHPTSSSPSFSTTERFAQA